MAEVTVILPYFNREDVLGEAVASVLNQTHTDLHLLLIDDGSTDGSRRLAQSFTDSRVSHILNDSNRGVCAARNDGIEHAQTPLIAFMDSDDAWLPKKLEAQIGELREMQRDVSNVAVLGCGWRYMGGSQPAKDFAHGPFHREDVLMNRVSGTGTPMLLVDRERANPQARFDTGFPALVERDYLLSCLRDGASLGVAPEVLAEVRRGRADHVANPIRAASAWQRYLVKYEDELRSVPGAWSWYHYRAARELMVARRTRAALRHLAPALGKQGWRRAGHLTLGALAGKKGLALAARLIGRAD